MHIGRRQQRQRWRQDCGAGAKSLSTAVVVDEGSIGMEPMEPIGIDKGCGKDAAAVMIGRATMVMAAATAMETTIN